MGVCMCIETYGRMEPHLACNGYLVLCRSCLRLTCKQNSCQPCSRNFLGGRLIFIRPASTLLCLIVTGRCRALAILHVPLSPHPHF